MDDAMKLNNELNNAVVQYDLARRCERDDEDYWCDRITAIRVEIDRLAKADKP